MLKALLNRILCPVAPDDNARIAINLAFDLTQGTDAVIYLHVVPSAPAMGGVPLEPDPITRHDVEAEFTGTAPHDSPGRIQLKLPARKDDAEEILRGIGELKVDSVVMATHGCHGIGRTLVGSVVEKVMRESRQPGSYRKVTLFGGALCRATAYRSKGPALSAKESHRHDCESSAENCHSGAGGARA
jgi:nucleotide-binding universal stress UspA family protein